jgi:acetate CoA/acetoacetate CoA-transferase alpha subunit
MCEMNKVRQLDDIIDGIKDGATIMFGGFLGIGAPLKAIAGIAQRGVKDLTLICVCNSYPGGGFDLAPLFANRQVKKFIAAHVGTNPQAVESLKSGEFEMEFYPLGTWVEKVRAGGGGLGGVLTPIGIGTLVEEGKRKIEINGKHYLVELPLRAEYAFIAGYRADPIGNLEYRGIAINSNPIVAMAADYTVAEVHEIVAVGQIDPSRVGTPGIFVKAVVQGETLPQHQKTYADLWVRTGRLKPRTAERAS